MPLCGRPHTFLVEGAWVTLTRKKQAGHRNLEHLIIQRRYGRIAWKETPIAHR